MTKAMVAAICVICATGTTAASAGQPPPAVLAADRIVANTALFAGCAQGRAALALLAERSDEDALRSADDALQQCMRTVRDRDGVAVAELGIAATAFLAGQRHAGSEAAADYERAEIYARHAAVRWLLVHRDDYSVVFRPAGRASAAGIPTHVTTSVAPDGTISRTEVSSPIGSSPDVAYAPPPVLRERVPAAEGAIVKLARELESDARRERAAIRAPK